VKGHGVKPSHIDIIMTDIDPLVVQKLRKWEWGQVCHDVGMDSEAKYVVCRSLTNEQGV
jgi:hypothetical protein